MSITKDYVDIIYNEDISKVNKIQRNPTLAKIIMRAYARNLCTLAQKTSMLTNVSVETKGTSMKTFDDYVSALQKLFIIEDIEAWCPAIRSATAIRSRKNAILSILQ